MAHGEGVCRRGKGGGGRRAGQAGDRGRHSWQHTGRVRGVTRQGAREGVHRRGQGGEGQHGAGRETGDVIPGSTRGGCRALRGECVVRGEGVRRRAQGGGGRRGAYPRWTHIQMGQFKYFFYLISMVLI